MAIWQKVSRTHELLVQLGEKFKPVPKFLVKIGVGSIKSIGVETLRRTWRNPKYEIRGFSEFGTKLDNFGKIGTNFVAFWKKITIQSTKFERKIKFCVEIWYEF